MIRQLKDQISKRWPRAVSAYHVLRNHMTSGEFKPQVTADGFRFGGPAVMTDGHYEAGETAVIRQLVRGDVVFVDVGANAGYFVCMARHFGSRVIAVEPCAANLDLLYANLNANGWRDVEVFPLGVAASPGIATLYGSGTGASLLTRWAGTSELFSQTIPLSTLDVLIHDRFSHEQLVIKIDVEGAEYDVLRGATCVLHRNPRPVWVIEVCLTENHAAGMNPHFREVFALFRDAGYEARPVDALDRVVTEYDVDRWLNTGRRDFGYVGYVFADPATFAARQPLTSVTAAAR